MEKLDQQEIDKFVTIAGVSESFAIQKLKEHHGDLNAALDAYFKVMGSDESNEPVTHVAAPQQDPIPLLDADDFKSKFPVSSARRVIRIPTVFRTRGNGESHFSREIFDRVHSERKPVVSHPGEVKEIPVEVKDTKRTSSSPRHAPTTVNVIETEHEHGPGISVVATMTDDDDSSSDNDMPSRPNQFDHASDNDIPARIFLSDYLDDNEDAEGLMIRFALDASINDAVEKQTAKSFETGKEIVEDADELPLIRKKAERVSSSFVEIPKEVAENAPLSFSTTIDQDQNAVFQSLPHKEVDRQQASLPHEPLPDEHNVVNMLIHMPDGCRHSRIFLKSDKLELVFDFIQRCGGVLPGNYKLARTYHPCCTLSDTDGSLTLEEMGITGKEEAFYLKPM